MRNNNGLLELAKLLQQNGEIQYDTTQCVTGCLVLVDKHPGNDSIKEVLHPGTDNKFGPALGLQAIEREYGLYPEEARMLFLPRSYSNPTCSEVSKRVEMFANGIAFWRQSESF